MSHSATPNRQVSVLRLIAKCILLPLSYLLISKEDSASWIFHHEFLRYFWKRGSYYNSPVVYRIFFAYCNYAARKGGIVIGAQRLFSLTRRIARLTDRKCTVLYYSKQFAFYLALDDARSIVVPNEIDHLSVNSSLKKILRAGDTFIDIGANHGSYAIVAGRIVGANGSVLAIEPQRKLAEIIQKSLLLNICMNFKVVQCACGDREGVAQFWVPRTASGSAGLFPSFSARDQATEIQVRVRPLDEILDGWTVTGRTVVKIDVEGAELDCIVGGQNFIRKYHPAVIVELNPLAQRAAGRRVGEIVTVMEELGYSFCKNLIDNEVVDIGEASQLFPSEEGAHANVIFLYGLNH